MGHVFHGRLLHVAFLGMRLHASDVPTREPDHRSTLSTIHTQNSAAGKSSHNYFNLLVVQSHFSEEKNDRNTTEGVDRLLDLTDTQTMLLDPPVSTDLLAARF